MENLNVILTMSSQTTAHGNRKLRGYCRDFAGLVGYTTINWMTAWPEEALYCIAKAFLGEHPKVSYFTFPINQVTHNAWLRPLAL